MRRVRLAGLDVETSCLGFGCASLGSRVSARDGLRAASLAFDAGVTWFDVAPAYGGGAAESLLGEFVRTRRREVQICTKVGLRAPERGLIARAALPVVRRLAAAAPALRRAVRAAPGSRNLSLDLSGALVAASIAASLERLKTDHVDVLALHSPSPDVLGRDDILAALRRVLESGQARAVAVAGSTEAALTATRLGAPYSIVQLADDPWRSDLTDVRAAFGDHPLGVVTHSVFGVGGALDRASERLRQDDARLERLGDLGYVGPPERIAADVLLDRAFASNSDGVVLASMFDPRHLQHNVARASPPISREALAATKLLFD